MAGPLLMAAPAVAGLIGNLLDRKRRKREEDKASAGISNLTDIFKEQMGQDYFSSAEGSNAVREIDENAQENMNAINASAGMNGLTDEARIAMMGRNMKAKQGAYAGLAGQSNLWRTRNQQMYQGALGQLFNVGMANRENRQRSINNIVSGLQGGIDGGLNAGLFDSLGKKGGGGSSALAAVG